MRPQFTARVAGLGASMTTSGHRGVWRAVNAVETRTTPCYRISVAAAPAAPTTAHVYVYDVIGGWDLDAASFVQAVAAIDADAISLHVNSPGGYVFDAVSMYSALLNHAAPVSANVEGLAASAASFLALAGDTVTIEKPARMMIHDAAGIALGNAGDLREYAQLLDDVSNTIAEIYADQAGGDPATWRDAMLANGRMGTWYSSAQAVEAGLADSVANDTTPAPEPPDDRATQLIRARARVHLKG